jgi:hypothetical protein
MLTAGGVKSEPRPPYRIRSTPMTSAAAAAKKSPNCMIDDRAGRIQDGMNIPSAAVSAFLANPPHEMLGFRCGGGLRKAR